MSSSRERLRLLLPADVVLPSGRVVKAGAYDGARSQDGSDVYAYVRRFSGTRTQGLGATWIKLNPGEYRIQKTEQVIESIDLTA